jgi:hypothetical protein
MNNDIISAATAEAQSTAVPDGGLRRQGVSGRRSFLKGVGLAGTAALTGSALFAGSAVAESGSLTKGDVAILRMLAAAELIEADLWQQYDELGGVRR